MLEELIDEGIIYYEYKLKNVKLLEHLRENYQVEWGYLKNVSNRLDKRNIKNIRLATEEEREQIILKENLEDMALNSFKKGIIYI